ncbi:tape measure protein [Segatella copri]|uniref:tape measure protein n=1 Tax=Segatella copri TaxID=165179 RepID=UPI00222E5EF3|nr:tape measure protein [Segatella copri]MCW4101500.1 tape measure protein [Segatella copri]
MADGNLGDLWFQLGVKDNTSKELQKIIDKLKTGDDAANALLRALQGFGTKKSGFKEQAEKAKEFADVLNEINRRISKLKKNDKSDEAKDLQMAVKNALSYLDMLQRINIERSKISELRSLNPNVDTSKLREAELMLENINNQLFRLQNKAQGGGGGGVDSAKVLQDYAKVLQMTFRDVKQITDQFKKENPLSAFSGGAAKVEADIARVTEKLARMRDLMAEGALKGYNTNMLGGSITELDKILARLQAASGNKSILTDAAQMKNLLSDVAVEMTKAAAATQAYGREKGKVIAQEREFAAASKLSAKDNNAELKALSDYAKRYMALQEAKRKAEKQASDERKRQSAAEARRIEADTERMSRLYAKMSLVIGRGERAGMRGLELGVNTSALEKALSEATELKRRIEDANIALMGKGGRPSYSSYAEEVNKLSSSLANATQAQRELNSVQDKANRKAEVQAAREASQAKREEVAAEKQRQNELKNTERRYDSLGNKVRQLRSEYSRGITIGADVSKAEAEINRLISIMRGLRTIKDRLNSENWKDSLGMLGNIGSGHDTTLASRVLQDQKAINREIQRGVELEQKRQQAIVDSGAKIQSQLVRGFEKANSHAGKLNSTVQDLKSLFLQGGLVFGAQQFAMSIITTGGEMEKQHIALQSILGDMQNANTMFNQIKELALNSPFTFSELNRDVKQLAAYGVEYDQLYDTTKRLADMSSGLGVSFDRIALAFGQVQARGWLDGKELRQIAYAGIPLLEKLSEFYSKQEGRNVSTSEIKTRISSRDVSFDDVKSIFWQMTDAGGQFYNMQQVLSETLLGRYNKLKDAWEIMLADFANGKNIIGGTFKGILDVVTNLVQQIHVLGPAMVAAFAGPALMRGVKILEGGIGKRILNSKGNIAKEAELKLLRGEKITPVEKQILQYKNQIRIQDIQALAKANAITKAELRRLYVTGQITKEMYKQGMALTKQEGQVNRISLGGVLKGLASPSKWGAAGGLLLGGLKSGFSSIIGFLGGLPGIAISAGSAIFAYYWQKHQQLKQDMETTADELKDRYTQIGEFLRDNDADKAIKDGDEKEIENLIDAYKEKLKEIAPEKENAFTMSLLEKKSNEDRLKYLKEQLILLKQVEESTQKSLSDDGTYKRFDEKLSSAKEIAEAFSSASAKANMINATQSDFASFNSWEEKYKNEVKAMRDYLINELGDISNSPKLQGKANQILSSFFAKQGWNQDVSDQFRADVLNAMGVETGFYENKFKDALDNAVNTSFPWIGDKIRNNQELTDAERIQVSNMMKDAAAQVQKDYPFASDALKRMLAADRFEAVIHLVFRNDDSDLTQQLEKNLKGSGYDYHEKNKYVKSWGKDAGDDYDKAKSNAESDITATKEELNTRKNMLALDNLSLDEFTQKQKEYELKMQAYHDNWGEWFTGDDKKKNKKTGGRRSTGAQTDKALEDLRKRIDLYKKMYAEIKKFKELYGEGALGQLANDGEFEAIFNDKKRFPISDYTNYETSIKELLKTLPASTRERLDYAANEKAGIQTENRKLLEDQRREELNVLNKQLDTISEQYETYKKIYELTGNKKGSENIAFGGTVQFDTYKKFLEEQLDIAVKHDNVQSGLNFTTDEVKGMSLENVKDKYGEETRVYDIRKKLEDENNKIKKETIDLMASLIEKNATIAQQIEDENRKYERQLDLIKGIEDPQMRDRAKAGATKTHNENLAKLQFEQFKQESDWVAIFDDLDRVSSSTINSMIEKIDQFSMTTGLSVESIKQLRDALDKLRNEQISRNPFGFIFGGVNRGKAIGKFINERLGGMDDTAKIFVSKEEASRLGIAGGVRTKASLKNDQQSAYADSSKAISELATKMQALNTVLDPVINLFKAMGEEDSILGQIVGGASGAFSSAASTAGAFDTLGKMEGIGFLKGAGPYAAAASAALSIGGSLIKAFGADYSSYNKAKAEYDNLTSIWDSLISKKTEYMNIHWGTEATEASKEAQEMLKAEIEQTKVIAQKRLNSGASVGSHSIWYRMWKGSYKYNGQNWRDVAGEISSKYGVQFNGMEDMLNMDSDTLSKIKKDYTGLWASMDSEFRDYLEKLIQYGEKADDMIEALTEKLTGNKFSDLVSSWGDTMATMANSSDNLVEHFEDNLKKTILNSMIENIYGDKIKALLKKTQGYAENGGKIKDSNGNVISEFTGAEYADVKNDTDELSKQIEATRDYLKKEYGWSDNSSSSSRNSIKSITEETGDLIASYLNAIRLDCSVMRAEQSKYYPEMSEIAKSQLTQLNAIARNTLRNADAAERIESIFVEYNDNFNRVLNGTKSLKMK